jgi:hypothetical protein
MLRKKSIALALSALLLNAFQQAGARRPKQRQITPEFEGGIAEDLQRLFGLERSQI